MPQSQLLLLIVELKRQREVLHKMLESQFPSVPLEVERHLTDSHKMHLPKYFLLMKVFQSP